MNGIATYRGGSHVQLILGQILDGLQAQSKMKQHKLNANQVREHLKVYINCTVEDPTFNSQTKECLTNNFTKKWQESNKFAPKLTTAFVNDLVKQGILDVLIKQIQFAEQLQLGKKTDGQASKNTSI